MCVEQKKYTYEDVNKWIGETAKDWMRTLEEYILNGRQLEWATINPDSVQLWKSAIL